MDHDNYIMNLTEANLDNKPIWQFEYSAKVGCVWVLLGFCNVKACCIDSDEVWEDLVTYSTGNVGSVKIS